MHSEKGETQRAVKKKPGVLAAFQLQLFDGAFKAWDFRKVGRLPGFQIAQDIMLPVFGTVDRIVFVAFHFLQNQLDG